ncbi:von Willebrand factor type A domain-containing protein [Ammonicoccus fulvus]|uniref:von Willebrand factor type A domain-containing protein n=1 Tax=Ammonicoccus fulvus TaxID=3138240 RepID=A0ABZ3FNR3_9ACTN
MSHPDRLVHIPRGVPRLVAASLTAAVFLTGCAGTASRTTGGEAAPVSVATQGAAEDAREPGVPVDPTRRPVDQNPTVDTREDNLSTIALDVDTGSFTRTRAQLNAGMRPTPAEVRTEEFVNYLNQGYRPPADGLGVQVDGTAVPWLEAPDKRVIRVGVQSAVVDQASRPRAHLTFVIDVSGSMQGADKLDLVKTSLNQLVGSLRPDDTVAIVVYSNNTRVVLEPTEVRRANRITGVIDDLDTEGSTNAEAGLKLGYESALKHRRDGDLNRVVLLSDGVANVGNTGPEAILDTIGKATQQKIDLVTVGFGLGSYNDELMEQLADKGNGFHAYVDNENEARRIFTQNLTGTLVVTARDAKAQIEFDPDQVATYRLLGYENREVADEDFRNDQVDGGELGAGHSATALYEVTLRPGAVPTRPLAVATVRYLHPDNREAVERRAELMGFAMAPSPEQANPFLAASISAAALSEEFRGGPWSEHRTHPQIAVDAAAAARRTDDQSVRELAEVADLATRV